MNSLVKYDAARYALQQAVAVDEVKNIRDKAQAMAAYAKQAKDTELVQWATEIKVRAERKAGQMLAEMPKNKGAATRSHDATASEKTLAEIGISKTQSSRWQKLALATDDQFEQAVAAAKEVAGEVTTAAMLRIERANNPPKEKENIAAVAPPAPVEKEKDENHYDPYDDALADAHETVIALSDENQQLKDAIAVGKLPESEQSAGEIIKELRSEVKILSATISAITIMRDSLLRENKELKDQCAMQRKIIKKLEDKK